MEQVGDVKEILEELYERFNSKSFIENDPISIPHQFSKKEDVEIAAFLSATLAWGQRSQIILKANQLMGLMDFEPYSFVSSASDKEINRLSNFVYRTFQPVDATFFVKALKDIYLNHGGLEKVFTINYKAHGDIYYGLIKLHQLFLGIPHEKRSLKHIANVGRNSSAKRLNMFLRWMIRKDKRGVDFGLWESIPPSGLYLPLDVHTGRTARLLGLLNRKQNDWKSVVEVTKALANIDPEDPVKYDFSLFGAGVEKVF